jgi:hypothetical protein
VQLGVEGLAGGRFVRLDERAYDKRGIPQRHSRLSRFLPQTAVVWKATDQLNAYDVLVSDDIIFTTGALAAFVDSKKKQEVSA